MAAVGARTKRIEMGTAVVDMRLGGRHASTDRAEPDRCGIKGRVADALGSVPFLYVVFDLLFVDERSLLAEPLEERRRLLVEALRPDPRVRFSEHIERDGVAAFAAAKERGLEGIMAKDRRSPYQPGRAVGNQGSVFLRMSNPSGVPKIPIYRPGLTTGSH